MLSGPRALVSAEQTFGYFLHEYLARNDKAHRSANRWHGKGAEALGLGQREDMILKQVVGRGNLHME